MNNRLYWVDYSKALGIILVVYGHIARGLFNAGIGLPPQIHYLVDSIVYSFHMPLFFFLSGLFFIGSFTKSKTCSNLTLSKIDTIFYPYILWSLLQGTIEVLLSNYTNGSVKFSDVVSLFWEPRAQFWFLYVLFFTFTLSAFLYGHTAKNNSRIYLLFLPVLGFILFMASSTNLINLEGITNSFFLNYIFFTLGIIYSVNVKIHRILSSKYCLAAISIAFIFCQWIFHIYYGFRTENHNPLLLVVSIISILFIISFSISISSKHKLLAYIGASSMAIYLMHIIAGSGARVVLQKFLNIDSTVIHLLAGIAIGIFAPLIAFFIINKLKIPYLFSAPISKLFKSAVNYKRNKDLIS